MRTYRQIARGRAVRANTPRCPTVRLAESLCVGACRQAALNRVS